MKRAAILVAMLGLVSFAFAQQQPASQTPPAAQTGTPSATATPQAKHPPPSRILLVRGGTG